MSTTSVELLRSIDFKQIQALHYTCMMGAKETYEEIKDNLLLSVAPEESTENNNIPIAVKVDGVIQGFSILHVDKNIDFMDNSAYFSNLLISEDSQVATKLFQKMEKIAKQNNYSRIIGPIHHSVLVNRGVPLFKSDIIPFGMSRLKPHVANHLQSLLGYKPAENLVELVFSKSNVDYAAIDKFETSFRTRRLKNIRFDVIKGASLLSLSKDIAQVYNQALKNNWGFYPLRVEEVDRAFQKYMTMNNIGAFAFVEKQLVGFTLLAQDLHLSTDNSSYWKTYLIAVLESHQNKGIAPYLLVYLAKHVMGENAPNYFSCGWMLEKNKSVRSLVSKFLDSTVQERHYSIFYKNLERLEL